MIKVAVKTTQPLTIDAPPSSASPHGSEALPPQWYLYDGELYTFTKGELTHRGLLSSHLSGMKIKLQREFKNQLILVTDRLFRLDQPRVFTENNKTYFNLWSEASEPDMSLLTKDEKIIYLEYVNKKLKEENDRLKQQL